MIYKKSKNKKWVILILVIYKNICKLISVINDKNNFLNFYYCLV